VALRIFVEVESAPGVVVGAGPITEITALRIGSRLSQAGSWTMTLPANAPNAELLDDQRTVMAYVLLEGEKTFLGGGAIDRKVTTVNSDGRMTIEVGGVDLLGEWSREDVGVLTLDGTGAANIAELLGVGPSGWTNVSVGTPAAFARQFTNETPLTALVAVAKQMGHRFVRARGVRRLEYQISVPTNTSLTCVMNLNALEAEDNPYLATIVNITESRTSYDLLNRAYVYGAGSGENVLTLAAASVWPDDATAMSSSYIAPSGDEYFYNAANNRITNSDAFTRHGGLRSKRVQFPEVRLLVNTDVGLVAAANTLVKAAVAKLEQKRTPQVTYRMKLADLRTRLYPGDKIHIDARRWVDGAHVVDIDADAYVLSVTDILDANGFWTADVEASNILAWPETATTQMAQSAELAKVVTAHVQLTGNVDTIAHPMRYVSTAFNPRFYLFLAGETALVNSVVIRFRTQPLESFNGVVEGSDINTGFSDPLAHAGSTGVPSTSSTTQVVVSAPDHVHGLSAHTHPANTITAHDAHDHPLPWGHFSAPSADTLLPTDLEFQVNGVGSWEAGYTLIAASGATAWYELDLTAHFQNVVTRRPASGGSAASYFFVEARTKSSGLGVRTYAGLVVQSQLRSVTQQMSTF
jgi:hypothetical protein